MSRKGSQTVQKHLKETLSDHQFSRLQSYKDPKTWRAMSSDERELLGTLFALHGEEQLSRKSCQVAAFHSFDLATKAAPKNPEVFYKKGLAYSMQHTDGRRLASACRAFAKATALNPNYYDAWYAWGRTLYLMGERRSDVERFHQATEKFKQAENCTYGASSKEQGKFYWLWGHCWRCIGDVHGEACDYQEANQKFRVAAELGFDELYFWNDYGHVLSHLIALLGRDELFHEVVHIYKQATLADPENFEGWFNLACSSTCLYEMEGGRDQFEIANEAFEQAKRCHPDDANVCLYWGQLMLTAGKVDRDITKLEESVLLLSLAEELGHPQQSLILCRWGEALMNCGSYLENYSLLLESKEKLEQSIKLTSDVPEVWYFYGRCISEIGRYFNDLNYFMEAIEKYEMGKSLAPNFPPFFYGLALAYSEGAELTLDVTMLVESLKNFDLLQESSPFLPPQFWLDWAAVLLKHGEITRSKESIAHAIEHLEKAIVMESENRPDDNPLLIDILYHYGSALDNFGDFHDDPVYYERAIKVLAKVLEMDPKHINARYHLAIALTHLGELVSDIDCFQAANEQFEMILKVDPEDAMAWNDWGVSLIHWALFIKDPVHEQFSNTLLAHAETKFCQAMGLGYFHAFYNSACYHALTGNVPGVIHFLERAERSLSLPPVEEIMQDEWLASVRHTVEFRQFISRLIDDQA